jgi:hypothetical protein
MVSSAILPLCKDNTYRMNYKNSRSCRERPQRKEAISKVTAFVICMPRHDDLRRATGRDRAEEAPADRGFVRLIDASHGPAFLVLHGLLYVETSNFPLQMWWKPYPCQVQKGFDLSVAHNLNIDYAK